jgi:hypothetical protein
VEIYYTPREMGRFRMAKTVADQGEGQESYNLANPVGETDNPPIRRPLQSRIHSTLPNEGRGDRTQCVACLNPGPRHTPTLHMRVASANSAPCPTTLPPIQ